MSIMVSLNAKLMQAEKEKENLFTFYFQGEA